MIKFKNKLGHLVIQCNIITILGAISEVIKILRREDSKVKVMAFGLIQINQI